MSKFNLIIRVKGHEYEAYKDNGYYYANIHGKITAVHVDDADMVLGNCQRDFDDLQLSQEEIDCVKSGFSHNRRDFDDLQLNSQEVDELLDAISNDTAMSKQIGGNHYKDLAIQPIEYCHKNKMGYCESNVVKYVTRWKFKNGLEDLRKAKHNIDLLIELEGLKDDTRTNK